MHAWADQGRALPTVGAMNGARLPQLPGDRDRRNLEIGPPIALVAVPMQLAMMRATKRNGELVAHLSSQRARPRDLQMMCVARPCPAHQTGLRRHKSKMRLAAPAHRFG